MPLLTYLLTYLLWHEHTPRDVCVTDDTLSQATPDLRQMLLQFIDVINLMSVTNVSVHASMPKAIILAFNVTRRAQTIKFMWLILSTTRHNGDIRYVRILLFLVCFAQGSVATRCRCGGKYDMSLVANLLMSPTVKNLANCSTSVKVMNEY